MPPSSRKRSKGKERKAKREAKEEAKKEESDRADANAFWRSFCISNMGCNRGHAIIIRDDDPISNFMDQFCLNFGKKEMTSTQNLRELFKSHTHVWNNDTYRKSAILILVIIGTNMLVNVKEEIWVREGYNTWLICIAQAILVLEQYNGTGDIDSAMNKRGVVSKGRDFVPGGSSERRDVLKFFRKRTPCKKCVKKMHLEARKTTPKMGICNNCEEVKERVALSVCGRCKIAHYCSRECQIAAWPEHERRCDVYVEANRN